MNWTNRQRLSLAGAASIQAVLFWMFFHQAVHLPALPNDGREIPIVQAHLAERVDVSSSISHASVYVLSKVASHSQAKLKIPDIQPAYRSTDQEFLSDADYLPTAMLTDKPSVVIDIDPELSRRFAFILPQSLTLCLLINEYGDVDRVLLAGPLAAEGSAEALPPVLLEELMQRFREARFLPGRLHGQAVRSALTIRVSLGT
ncbi:MAG: hypothetical protein RL001_815 [Pseudomonadota bacterium]